MKEKALAVKKPFQSRYLNLCRDLDASPVPVLGKVLSNVLLYFHMLWDLVTGSYKRLPVSTFLAYALIIVYAVSPIDIIPDLFVPVLGTADDFAVFGFLFVALDHDVGLYRKWKYAACLGDGVSEEVG